MSAQVKADHHTARARVATAQENPELWRIMTATGAPYDEFQAKADGEIPVVVLEPAWAERPLNSTTPNASGPSAGVDGDAGRTFVSRLAGQRR